MCWRSRKIKRSWNSRRDVKSFSPEPAIAFSLEERTAMANKLKADMFISVHANAPRIETRPASKPIILNLASDQGGRSAGSRGERQLAEEDERSGKHFA
jgi:N-acetylmuramoyl-L-alanine amidase